MGVFQKGEKGAYQETSIKNIFAFVVVDVVVAAFFFFFSFFFFCCATMAGSLLTLARPLRIFIFVSFLKNFPKKPTNFGNGGGTGILQVS